MLEVTNLSARYGQALSPDDIVLGQFEGYRDEEGVAPGSDVETFTALRLEIDSWRWAGVPFYLRTGKRLPQRCSEIVVSMVMVGFLPMCVADPSRLARTSPRMHRPDHADDVQTGDAGSGCVR